ncbi:MAG: hypothetical protein JW778_00475 [Candidatus Altiarchaeota archaeon]|nr:hypothetical protein [Candidatus Altiarchaeota archaeon]
MAHNLKQEIGKNWIILVVIPHETYPDCSIEVSKQIERMYQRICYVNTNKPFTTLMKTFKDKGINTEGFFFIDMVTRSAFPGVKDGPICRYISSESALDELGSAINEELDKGVYKALIFDSLSSLLVHNDEDVLIKFVKFIVTKIRHSDCIAVLKCAEGDIDSKLMKNLSMLSDKIIRLSTHTVMGLDETIVSCDLHKPKA